MHLECIVIRCSFYLIVQLIEEFEVVTGKTGLSDMFGVKWKNWVPKMFHMLKLLDESNMSNYSCTNSMFIYDLPWQNQPYCADN